MNIELGSNGGAASYKFNSFEEIKSHSSILSNERLAIIFYLLDMRSIDMNTHQNVNDVLVTKALLQQIYINIRTLLRYNPVVRVTLNLETKDHGVYTTDVAFDMITKMIEYCDENGYTQKKLYIIIKELNSLQTLIRDILQYFHFFYRPDFRQKPDIEIATLKYKQIADARTIDELKAIVGKSNKVDFENLGIKKIDMQEENEQPQIEQKDDIVDDNEIHEWETQESDEEDNTGSNPASDGNYDSKNT